MSHLQSQHVAVEGGGTLEVGHVDVRFEQAADYHRSSLVLASKPSGTVPILRRLHSRAPWGTQQRAPMFGTVPLSQTGFKTSSSDFSARN
jgi:hypothetical protein